MSTCDKIGELLDRMVAVPMVQTVTFTDSNCDLIDSRISDLHRTDDVTDMMKLVVQVTETLKSVRLRSGLQTWVLGRSRVMAFDVNRGFLFCIVDGDGFTEEQERDVLAVKRKLSGMLAFPQKYA